MAKLNTRERYARMAAQLRRRATQLERIVVRNINDLDVQKLLVKDAKDLRKVALMLQRGYVTKAAKRFTNLDTSVKDDVPDPACQFLWRW